MLHVENVLHDQKIDPETGADLLDAGGVFQPVNPDPEFVGRGRSRHGGREVVAEALLEPRRRIADQMDVRLRAALAVIDELFGQQVVFHDVSYCGIRRDSRWPDGNRVRP